MQFDSDLEQQIYEAAVLPEHWPAVLRRLAERAESVGAVIFGNTDQGLRWVASPEVRRQMEIFLSEGWYLQNSRAENGFRKGLALEPRFLTESDIYDGDEYERDPLYTDYFRPHGLGWSAGTIVTLPRGDFITISVERAYDCGPMTPEALSLLNGYRPHLARSAMLATRLAFERTRTAVDTLAMLGMAEFAVSDTGRLIIANSEFEADDRRWTTRAGDRLAFRDERANRLFYDALDLISTESGVRSIPHIGEDPDDRAVLHIVPIRRGAHDLFVSAAAIGVLTRDNSAPGNAISLLQALFDLTATEARVASLVGSGKTVAEIARIYGRSVMTVRQHLKQVFQKTGCHRQAELTRLLARLVPSER